MTGPRPGRERGRYPPTRSQPRELRKRRSRPDQSKQMGFAMAAGILIASLVVSGLLVPAIAALVGRKAWWPGMRGRLHRMPAAPIESPQPAVPHA